MSVENPNQNGPYPTLLGLTFMDWITLNYGLGGPALDRRVSGGQDGTNTAAPAAVPSPLLTSVPALPTKSSAMDAAQRQRRRAAAGNAGNVTTGTPTLLQQQIQAGGTPRTLIGR